MFLRLGGLVFFSGAIVIIIQHHFAIIEAGFAVAAGVACFVLANRRSDVISKVSRRGT
jgi:hypothetical protein